MAPLHGVTNRIFRKAWFRHFSGFDAAMAPFILAVRGANPTEAHFKELDPDRNPRVPIVPQLLGNDAAAFVSTASVVSGMGYGEVDWNLGCPYPMVTNKRRGSGLLPYPDLIEAFLEHACGSVSLSLTVKLRLGLRDPKETLEVIPILNRYPLKGITIHPRVGSQLYGGTVDLDGFAAASSLSAHEVTYNGDIRAASAVEGLSSRFPRVRRWMIGRAAVIDPFLPSRIKGRPLPSEPAATIRAFHDDVYFEYREALQGQRHVLDKMKELWSYLGGSFPDAGGGLKGISKSTSFLGYDDAVREVFCESGYRPCSSGRMGS